MNAWFMVEEYFSCQGIQDLEKINHMPSSISEYIFREGLMKCKDKDKYIGKYIDKYKNN